MPAIQHWAAETTNRQKVQNETDTESSEDETGHQFFQWRTSRPVELFRTGRVPRPSQTLFSSDGNLFAVAVRQEHYGECRLHRTNRDRHTSYKSFATYRILFLSTFRACTFSWSANRSDLLILVWLTDNRYLASVASSLLILWDQV